MTEDTRRQTLLERKAWLEEQIQRIDLRGRAEPVGPERNAEKRAQLERDLERFHQQSQTAETDMERRTAEHYAGIIAQELMFFDNPDRDEVNRGEQYKFELREVVKELDELP